MRCLRRRVAAAQRWLTGIYRLELDLRAERFLLDASSARALLPGPNPRSGVVVLEEDGQAYLGLYIDPVDSVDAATIVEETSHLVCLAWHAARERPVSWLHLELQSEVDRYAVARLAGADGLEHFRNFRWADWLDPSTRGRYQAAHGAARSYCQRLEARFPKRADTPGLLAELRRFYRATPQDKLRAA
jgi:hypothetical protein